MIQLKEILSHLEELAPKSSQEQYDNAGLLVGNPAWEVKGILVALDATEEVVEEAIQKGCNVLVVHHPIIFKGLKQLTGKNYVERVVLACIKNDIALYAIHTNLDNAKFGVNYEIGKRLGLINLRVLNPKSDMLSKLVVFVPHVHAEQVRKAAFHAGAGKIGNYIECHFGSEGIGTFLPIDGAKPYTGELGKRSEEGELKLEFLVSNHHLNKVVSAVLDVHPYEEVAYDIYALKNVNQDEGAGMIGELKEDEQAIDFLTRVKETFGCGIIRHTALTDKPIRKVAFCGGAGSFLLEEAKRKGADIYLTGDVKYHEFFDADGGIIFADIGHFESEQFTSHLLVEELKKKFTTFAVLITDVNTNPINYF
jgi:dinuclear metal center YbgI/SA1388 family protein